MRSESPKPFSAEDRVVFLFTDASYCQMSGAGGWACCVVDEPGYCHFHSGFLGKAVNSSSDAERYALRHGIAFAAVRRFAQPGVRLVVFTDHLNQVNAQQDVRKQGIRGQMAREIEQLCQQHGFRVSINHVKAHVPKGLREAHHEINAQVDHLARSKMKIVRHRIERAIAHRAEQEISPSRAFA